MYRPYYLSRPPLRGAALHSAGFARRRRDSSYICAVSLVACALSLLLAADEPAISRALAQEILFDTEAAPSTCTTSSEADQIRCLITARYAKDVKAQKTALAFYDASGTVMGVLPEQDFEGGYRGRLHLVPKLPVGALRTHLDWASGALTDFDVFFAGLKSTPNFRWRALDFRFFESVKRRTPSAFAVDWSIGYNVSGSLFGSEAGVRNTLFHEVFHLNDQAHRNWSHRALGTIYDRIVEKCGERSDCLEPYAPDALKVKGGTYYSFHKNNGVGEYAADLARRYYAEQRAILRGEKHLARFKCRTPENKEAWKLIVDEFFGGVDLTRTCFDPVP